MPLTALPGPAVTRRFLAFANLRTLAESGAATGAYYVFRINSIYDPDFTGTGSSAVGYTALSAFYNRYRVMRVRVKLRISSISSGVQAAGVVFGINNNVVSISEKTLVEPGAWARTLTNNSGPNSYCELDTLISLPKLLGITRSQYAIENEYAATFGTNPNIPLFAYVFILGSSASAQSAAVDLRMCYDTQLMNTNIYI